MTHHIDYYYTEKILTEVRRWVLAAAQIREGPDRVAQHI